MSLAKFDVTLTRSKHVADKSGWGGKISFPSFSVLLLHCDCINYTED